LTSSPATRHLPKARFRYGDLLVSAALLDIVRPEKAMGRLDLALRLDYPVISEERGMDEDRIAPSVAGVRIGPMVEQDWLGRNRSGVAASELTRALMSFLVLPLGRLSPGPASAMSG
jgi:hypothetical protein